MIQEIDQITGQIVDAAMKVHTAIGPGLLESAYEACLAYELTQRGLSVERQVALPIIYQTVRLDCGYRMDMVINHKVIVEIKAIQQLEPIHEAQLLSYLRLADKQVGLLLNFHTKRLRDGLRRIVNNYPSPSAISAASAVNHL